MNTSYGTCSCASLINGTSSAAKDEVSNIPSDIVAAFYAVILLLNIIGNTIVAIVLIFQRKMQTFTNYMILNLALADLTLGILCIPLEIPLELNGGNWIYGDAICAILVPLQTATLYVSVFTLTLLSCSRYYAIVRPLQVQPRKIHAKIAIGVIWLLSFVLVTPHMASLKTCDVSAVKTSCEATWPRSSELMYTAICFVLQYIIPLIIMAISYSLIIYDINFNEGARNRSWSHTDEAVKKENKKLTKLLIVLTSTFIVGELPFQIIYMIMAFKYLHIHHDITVVCYTLLLLNSALNPFLYSAFSSNFRKGLSDLVNDHLLCFKNKKTRLNRQANRKSRTSTNTTTFLMIEDTRV